VISATLTMVTTTWYDAASSDYRMVRQFMQYQYASGYAAVEAPYTDDMQLASY